MDIQFEILYIASWGYGVEPKGLNITNNKWISKSTTQTTFRNVNSTGTFNGFGTSDNNIFARPINDVDVIQTSTNNSTYTDYTLAEWQTLTSQDAHSIGSPYTISSESELSLVYNNSKSDSTIVLGNRRKDLNGTTYTSITLSPYTSKILFYVGELTNSITPLLSGRDGKIFNFK